MFWDEMTIAQKRRAMQMKHGNRFSSTFSWEFNQVWQLAKTDEQKHKMLDSVMLALDNDTTTH